MNVIYNPDADELAVLYETGVMPETAAAPAVPAATPTPAPAPAASWRYDDDPLPIDDEPVTCFTCHGSGECSTCDGTGKYDYYGSTIGKTCRTCYGNGRCPGCNGRGVYD